MRLVRRLQHTVIKVVVDLFGSMDGSALLYLYKVSAGFRLMYSINNINKTIIIMVKQNLLTKLLLLFALIVGSTSVWAEDEITLNFSDYATANSWVNETAYTGSISINSDVSVSCVSGGNNGKYYTSNTSWRHYESNNGAITITTNSGTLNSITFTYANNNKGVLIYEGTNYATGTECTAVSGQTTATFTVGHSSGTKAGNVQIQTITVKYTPASSDPSSEAYFAVTTPSISFPATTTYSQVATTAEGYDGIIIYEITANTAGATISGSTVTVTQEGSVTVKATAPAITGFAKSEASYTLTVTDTRTKPDLTFAENTQSVTVDETLDAPILTNPNNLVVTYSSDNTSVATVDANGNVTGVAAGTATITASFDGNDEYKPGSASYTIIVNKEELAYNVKETISNLGYEFWSEITSSKSSADEINGSQNGISIKIEKATGTAPRADDSYVRFYKNCLMTISAPSGAYITKIQFLEPSTEAKWEGSMDVNKGFYDNSSKTWYATETDVTKLVLTGVTGTNRIGGMEIYLMVSPLSITPAKQYVSFCSPYALDFTDTGLTAYVVSAETETSVSLTAVNRVPANTGLVLKGTANTNYTVPVLSGEADTFENKLEATGTEGVTVDANSVYVLSDGQFKLYTGTTIVGGKAYLPTTSGAPALSLDFGEGTTGINLTSVNGLHTTDNVYFDLSGRRIAQPTKGLYIVNGKKVLVP